MQTPARRRLPLGPETFTPHSDAQIAQLAGRRLAPFQRRMWAILLDFVIAAVGFILVALPVSMLLARSRPNLRVHFGFFDNWYSIAWLVLYFGLTTYWFEGQSPGKKVMKLRVASLHHEHLSLWHSFERALGYGASTLEGGFGFLQYFIHPYRQTVHDRIAETIVLDERPDGEAPGNAH
ncbi:MAG: RDD family protein [Gemmatimonadaceae bacterium]